MYDVAEYFKKHNGKVLLGEFNDDWLPISGNLLDNLLNSGTVVINMPYVVWSVEDSDEEEHF